MMDRNTNWQTKDRWMVSSEPFPAYSKCPFKPGNIAKQRSKEPSPVKVYDSFRITLHIAAQRAVDQSTFPLIREFPCRCKRQFLIIFWERRSARPYRRCLGDKMTNKRSISFRDKSQHPRVSFPCQGTVSLARWPPCGLNRTPLNVTSDPRCQIAQLIALRQHGGKTYDSSVYIVRPPQ